MLFSTNDLSGNPQYHVQPTAITLGVVLSLVMSQRSGIASNVEDVEEKHASNAKIVPIQVNLAL